MATRITESELSRNLASILDRVQRDRESFVIERDGEQIGALRPAPTEGATWADLARVLHGKLTHDGSFADDIEAAHNAQGEPQIRDWPS